MYHTNYASYLSFFIYLSYYIKVFIHACDTYYYHFYHLLSYRTAYFSHC